MSAKSVSCLKTVHSQWQLWVYPPRVSLHRARALYCTTSKVSLIASAYGLTIGSRNSSRYLRAVGLPPGITERSVHPSMDIPAHTITDPPPNLSIWNNVTFRIPLASATQHSHACRMCEEHRLPVAHRPSDVFMGKPTELSGELSVDQRSESVLWKVFGHQNIHLCEDDCGQTGLSGHTQSKTYSIHELKHAESQFECQ